MGLCSRAVLVLVGDDDWMIGGLRTREGVFVGGLSNFFVITCQVDYMIIICLVKSLISYL